MRRLSAQAFETGSRIRSWSSDVASCAGDEGICAVTEEETAVYRQAYLDGFAEGDTDARKALEAEREEARVAISEARAVAGRWHEQVVAMTARFEEARIELAGDMESLAVAIAFESVTQIVGAMHAERSLVPAICRSVLAELRLPSSRVRVSETDKAILEEAGLNIEVIADPSLQAGACVIETGLGEIETSITQRLENLSQALLDTLRSSESRT